MEIKGLKELQAKLKKLEKTQSIPLPTLLNPQFVSACSKFSNAQELFDATGLDIKSSDDLERNRGVLDEFIVKNTSYGSWSELLKAAGSQYMAAQLK